MFKAQAAKPGFGLSPGLNWESIHEESLIDWEKLKDTVPGEVQRCMAAFAGQDSRTCLLAALRNLQEAEAANQATEDRLHELQTLADDWAQTKTEPERLNLAQPGEYELFTVLRNCAAPQEESYLADCARRMITHSGWRR